MAKTLLISPRITEDSIILNNKAIDIGWDVERCYEWRDAENFIGSDKDIFVYSEWLFGEYFMQTTGIQYYVPDELIITKLEKNLDLVRGRKFYVCEGLKDLVSLTQRFGRIFAKPINSKAFTGRVFNRVDLFEEFNGQEDIPILASDVIDIDCEMRFFISSEKIETKESVLSGSPMTYKKNYITSRHTEFHHSLYPYKENILLKNPNSLSRTYELASSFVRRCLMDNNLFNIPYSYSLDVGYDYRRNTFFLIELNPIWQSGLYGVNPINFLKLLEESKIK